MIFTIANISLPKGGRGETYDINGRVLDWAIEMVRNKYADDIAILAVYGSYVNKTAHPLSDVDFYFIPKTDRGRDAARTFIIGNIGYDLFPMSWERVEGLSKLNEPIVPLLGDSIVAYHSTDDDLDRFLALRKRLQENLSDYDFMHSKALQAFDMAEIAYSQMRMAEGLCSIRLMGSSVLLHLSDALAYENRTYFHKGLKGQYDDLKAMEALPEGFLEQYEACIQAHDATGLKSAAYYMLSLCRNHLLHVCGNPVEPILQDKIKAHVSRVIPCGKTLAEEPASVNYPALVSFYEEALSSFNKIYHYCNKNVLDCRMAFLSAVCLQKVLDEEVPWLAFDLLGSFDCRDLPPLSCSTKSIEEKLVSYISRAAIIKRHSTIEEFRSEIK